MGEMPDASDLVEVVLDAVKQHVPTGQQALMLRERAGERFLVLWVGPFEANAAAMRLNDMTPARPVTHDLLAAVVERARVTVDRVVITHQEEQVFYATVHLSGPAGPEEIDARPSDAINVALRTGTPILVNARVMDEAARVPDPAGGPRPGTFVAMALEAGTGQEMGLVHLHEMPGPGDQVPVHAPTGWRVVSVELAEGDAPPRIVVRRPTAE